MMPAVDTRWSLKKAKDKKAAQSGAAKAATAKKPAKKTAPVKPVAKKPAAKPAPAPKKAAAPVMAKKPAAKPAPAPAAAKKAPAASNAAKPAVKPPAKPEPAKAQDPKAKTAPKAAGKTPEIKAAEPIKAGAKGTAKVEAAKAAAKPVPPKGPVRALAVSAAPTRPLPQPVRPPDPKPSAPSKIVQPKTVPVKVKVDFSAGDHVVYPTHGVGKVLRIERQSIAGFELDLMVVEFERDKMTVRIPLTKVQSVGIRKLSSPQKMRTALDTLKGRARVKRAMWSRRAQEYEAKINSGDPVSIAEVVRDLHRNAGQPDQSYSERQIYESALDRLVRELAAVERIDEDSASKKLDKYLKAA